MRFDVRHRTEYRYASPVRLGPQLLRLSPRPEAVRDLSQDIEVFPAPAARTQQIDAHGNPVLRLEFDGKADRLVIDSRFTAQTLPPAPRGHDAPPPAPRAAPAPTPLLRAFAGTLGEAGDPDAFLDRLNRALYEKIDRKIRPAGAAHAPEQTLRLGHGACRDLTLLFMALARTRGIPTRFASGYQARTERADGSRYLHAWPEAWTPAWGWRGYDPTHGLPVEDHHVTLAVAPDQAGTMPVEGGYFAAGPVASTLDFSLTIETC